MFPPGFFKAWPLSVGSWGDSGTVHPRNCPTNGHLFFRHLFFRWKEGSTERVSDLYKVTHLREPGCVTQSHPLRSVPLAMTLSHLPAVCRAPCSRHMHLLDTVLSPRVFGAR